MSREDTSTGAATGAAPADAEEKDVKIPVEAADEAVETGEAVEAAAEQVAVEAAAEQVAVEAAAEQVAAEAAEAGAEDAADAAAEAPEMTEEEMVEAAIRAGEEAANNDFKVKYEAAAAELAAAQGKIDAAEAKAAEAVERVGRLQADWENFRRRTAKERLEERDRATEKLVCALFPVVDDMERAIDHARAQEMDEALSQFVDGVDAVRAKLLGVFEHEGVEAIDPKGEAFDPNVHQAVGRVEDAEQYDETVNDVYQKGYRMAGKVLRPAMVTVTYGGDKRPVEEPAEDGATE